VTGVDLDAVAELDEAAQAVEEALCAVAGVDGEIRARRVADEQGVAGEHEPRLVAARPVDHREGAVLGPVPGRVDRPQHRLAEHDLGPVLERFVRELGCRCGVDAHRDAVLEREAAVPRDVVGVGVRLEHADDLELVVAGRLDEPFDRVRRIDDDRGPGALVSDEVRGAAEIVVDELAEEHGATVPPYAAMNREVTLLSRPRAPRRGGAARSSRS
jgi:hypothetical protein